MTNVLVLGGAGFIGYHLTRYLAQVPNYRVTVVDNLSRGRLDSELKAMIESGESVSFVEADLTREESFASIGGQFDQVYVLAGIVGVAKVQQAPAKVLSVNTGIILNTFNWLARSGCNRVLFASTSEAYAGSVELGLANVPTPEDVPLAISDVQRPRSTYALTKSLGESFLIHHAEANGYRGVAVRFHNVYGPRMGFSHVIPELMQRIHAQMDPLPVFGLDQTRAFCYVSDAVRACVGLMESDLSGAQLVNVGNDTEEVSIASLLEKLLRVTGFYPDIVNNPAAAGGVARRCPDISRLREMIEFEPQFDLETGLQSTWDWYRRALDTSEGAVLEGVRS